MSSGPNGISHDNPKFKSSEYFYAILARSSPELQKYVTHMVQKLAALIAEPSDFQSKYDGDWEIFK